MYRTRPLIVVLKQRSKILTAQRQVVRCNLWWQCGSFSKKQFSDSVKVLTDRVESEEKDESEVLKKSSKQKLFSIEDVLPEKENIIRNPKTTDSTRSALQFRTSDEILKEKVEERELTEPGILDERETRKDTVELSNDQEQLELFESEGKRTATVEFEAVEKRTGKWEIFQINSAFKSDKVQNILNSCLSKSLNLQSKNSVIVCAFKRLEKLKVLELGNNLETKLQDHLDYRSQVTKTYTTDLINMLDYFIKGSFEDNQLTYTVLHELCWRLRKSSVSLTLGILGILKHKLTTDKRKEVYMLGKRRLIENIENVSTPGELLSVMYLIDGKDEAWPRVEKEALLMLQSMDSVQTYRLIYLLALNRSKNIILVTKARKQLCSRPVNLDIIKLKNLFFSCEVLRINDPHLLQEMSVNMMELLESDIRVKGNNISLPVLRSCSKIGWNHRNLTDLIMKDICRNADSVDSKKRMTDVQLAGVIMSLGHLNLVQYADFGLQKAELLKSRKPLAPTDLLNVIHSLACLQKCERGSVQEVLSPEFHSALEESIKDQPAYLKDNVKRKLLSLYGHLKEDLHETSPDIENKALKWRDQLQEKLKSVPIAGLAKVVSEVLVDIAPLEKYTNRNVVTKYGYTMDFEIFVDKKLKAVRLDCTEGTQKVWIKMLDYSGFIQGSTEPEYTGSTAMMLRHLKSEQDAAIVYIPYTDWRKYDKKIDHLLYLETKIKWAVDPETQEAT